MPRGGPGPAVLWDMDGTLIDSEPLHEEALRVPLADEGIEPPADWHAWLLGLGSPAIHALCRDRLGLRAGYEAWLARRWQAYLEHAPRLKPRPGALQAWEAVHAKGRVQAVVSNGDHLIIEANLAAIGLRGRPALVIGREDVRHAKPHPEPYALARRRLGLDGGPVMAVEDSAAGTRSAVAAGCLAFYWPQGPAAPVPGARLLGPRASLQRALRAMPRA